MAEFLTLHLVKGLNTTIVTFLRNIKSFKELLNSVKSNSKFLRPKYVLLEAT